MPYRRLIAAAMIAALAPYAATGAPKAAAPKMAPDGTPIGDRPVLLVAFDEHGRKPIKGDTVPFSPRVADILYLDLPCPLPIDGAENMHRWASPIGVGCWEPLLSGGFERVDRYGHINQSPYSIGQIFETAVFHTAAQTFTIIDADAMWYERSITEPSGGNSKY